MIGDIGGNPNGYNKDVLALTTSGSITEQFLFLAGTILLGESRRHLAKPRTTWLQLVQLMARPKHMVKASPCSCKPRAMPPCSSEPKPVPRGSPTWHNASRPKLQSQLPRQRPKTHRPMTPCRPKSR
ncbi:hypothetical protein D8674_013277 [Pyrus ussuriensis x Pyrus communis]|uniref:Uncharacterized protein n=1 Tax=Pyrus ussuriensis x Pyrus communis TaxID=2448454 RepID=A0A5N5FPF5_9ROSA|nr:hypothetical protein D8674_036495 [Pyrus ussuriensis x Pyrus communis]KAB2617408.1 hypothetical protein D8674_013277 [Pyrus ussuriensis x Pyrus communis]